MTTTWTKPDILTPERYDAAVEHLKNYFHGKRFSGSYFERLGGGGDRREVANLITSDDLLSLSMLSVPVNGAAARRLLGGETAREVSLCLAEIPTRATVETSEGRQMLEDPKGPAERLWELLRGVRTFGRVRVSKLMARKRPHLFPIYDSVVASVLGISGSGEQWRTVVEMFAEEVFVAHLSRLRDDAGIKDDISLLRIADVAAWMEGTSGAPVADDGSAPPDEEY